MPTIQSKRLTHKLLADFASFGQLYSRSMFGGFGIYCNDIMFGWVYKEAFYLRATIDYVDLFLAQGMTPLSLASGVMYKLLKYYRVTDVLWQDRATLIQLVGLVISSTLKEKKDKQRIKEARLKDLPNMTLTLERSLIAVGIGDIRQFRGVGAYEAYQRLKKRNPEISINVLYSFCAALQGSHVAALSLQQKADIITLYGELQQQGVISSLEQQTAARYS